MGLTLIVTLAAYLVRSPNLPAEKLAGAFGLLGTIGGYLLRGNEGKAE